uniref:Uncharacterized protein n=1 Tax=Anguilla anguilla TaxID=7936 RepID=A0A0E9S6D9_ANGAN
MPRWIQNIKWMLNLTVEPGALFIYLFVLNSWMKRKSSKK